MTGKTAKRIFTALLAVVTALGVCPGVSAYSGYFTDVREGQWYAEYVERLTETGVIDGYGDGTFRPNDVLRCGHFIKLLAASCGYGESGAATVHWAEPSWHALEEAGIIGESGIACSAEALETEISRYQMAILTAGVLADRGEDVIAASEPESVITDYASIPEEYRQAVVQTYAKGVITGYDDGSFGGDRILSRAEGATLIVRLIDESAREPANMGDVTVVDPVGPADESYVPFALLVRQNGWLSAGGTPSPELCELLFGDSSKTYFANAAEAAPFMEEVTVQVWKLDSAGEKYASTCTFTVHRLVAEDMRRIFADIFASPEQFPIYSVGGARFSDKRRHAWGCAVDINWPENAYGYYTSAGKFVPVTGSGWFPYSNQYSITPDGSVVTAFAEYGWGWGGQGYSSGYADYMHFSIMEGGG